jgi:hypothetical protein
LQELVKDFRNVYEIVLRKKFGLKWGKVIGERRRLNKAELDVLYSSANTSRVIRSRMIRLVGHVARIADGRGTYGVLVGRPNGKIQLGRPRHIWKDNIKIDLSEVG